MKATSFDRIYTISLVKVVDDEGFVDTTGVASAALIIAENTKTGQSVGFFGEDPAKCQVFMGADRTEIVTAFVDAKLSNELESIFGKGKEASYFFELINGAIDGDLGDFEFENDASVSIGDSDNELELASLVDHVGISVCAVEGVKASINAPERSIRYNKQDVVDLGEWFNELQYDGIIRVVIVE